MVNKKGEQRKDAWCAENCEHLCVLVVCSGALLFRIPVDLVGVLC